MKIIAEDTYHRQTVADEVVCTGVQSSAIACFLREALQQKFGDSECRTFKVVSDDYEPHSPDKE